MELSHIKRFLEYWTGDPIFQARLSKDPSPTVTTYRIDVDPEACRVMINRELAQTTPPEKVDPDVRAYREWIRQKIAHRRSTRERGRTENQAFAAWRQRQLNRYFSEVNDRSFDSNVHTPWSIELSKGCSIGCEYCGFGAGRLTHVARFTAENERLFRDILRVMGDFFGEGADQAILYNATEPLDNPDYEKYLTAFFDEFGKSPQTTTAAWHHNLGRTRRLLEQQRAENGYVNRFSINSQEQFALCMESFPPEELEDVELILQFPEACKRVRKAAAGRGRDADPLAAESTIACTTGFRINLPERTVRLVSPTTHLERWPMGEILFTKGTFKTGKDLKMFLEDTCANVMEFRPRDDSVPHFRSDLQVTYNEKGHLCLESRNRRIILHEEISADLSRRLDGIRNIGQIVRQMMDTHPPEILYHKLRSWWRSGFLEDPNAGEEAHW